MGVVRVRPELVAVQAGAQGPRSHLQPSLGDPRGDLGWGEEVGGPRGEEAAEGAWAGAWGGWKGIWGAPSPALSPDMIMLSELRKINKDFTNQSSCSEKASARADVAGTPGR